LRQADNPYLGRRISLFAVGGNDRTLRGGRRPSQAGVEGGILSPGNHHKNHRARRVLSLHHHRAGSPAATLWAILPERN